MTYKISPIVLFTVLFCSSNSYAEVDLICQSNCLNKGYMLQYCQQACSYNANLQSTEGIDYSHGVAGAYNSLRQQEFRNQQVMAENQRRLQLRDLELEKLRLENDRLEQELHKKVPSDFTSNYKSIADSSTKSPMPKNADPDQYAIQGWSCKVGFTQVNKSCVKDVSAD